LEPPGHVVIHDLKGVTREGVVCSKHTLLEIVLDPGNRFWLEIIMDRYTGGVNAYERARATKKAGPKRIGVLNG
jgi:hypothetical protein